MDLENIDLTTRKLYLFFVLLAKSITYKGTKLNTFLAQKLLLINRGAKQMTKYEIAQKLRALCACDPSYLIDAILGFADEIEEDNDE